MQNIRSLFHRHAELMIIASNIRDGEDARLHPEAFFEDIANEVRVRLEQRFPYGDVGYEDYIIELEALCFGPGQKRVGSIYILQGLSPAPKQPPDWYTTVITVEHWQRYINADTYKNLRKQVKARLPWMPLSGGGSNELIAILREIKQAEFTPDRNFWIGNPVFWLTPRLEFDRRKAATAHVADFARDYLGLVHRAPPDHLIALHFPSLVIEAARTARPTFADAGRHRRFMVASATNRAPYDIAWGQTLDLYHFEQHDQLANGGAERVCHRIEAPALSGTKLPFEYLGQLGSTRGVSRATDDRFASMLIQRNQPGYSAIVKRI